MIHAHEMPRDVIHIHRSGQPLDLNEVKVTIQGSSLFVVGE